MRPDNPPDSECQAEIAEQCLAQAMQSKECAEGLLSEGRVEEAYAAFMEMFRCLEWAGQPSEDLLNLARHLAQAARDTGWMELALEFFEAGLPSARATGDATQLAYYLNEYAKTLRRALHPDQAVDRYTEALELASNIPDPTHLTSVLRGNRGIAYQDLSRLDLAKSDLEASLELDLSQDARSMDTARSYHNLAALHERMGQLREALRAFGQALRIDRGLDPSAPSVAITLHSMARVLLALGRPRWALHCAQTGERILANRGDSAAHFRDLLIVRNTIGSIYLYQGRATDAVRVYRQLVPQALQCEPDALARAKYLSNLGLALQGIADYPAAEQHYREALSLFDRFPDFDGARTTCLNNLGSTLVDAGRPAEAIPLLRAAFNVDAERGNRYGMARDAANLSAALRKVEDWKDAISQLRTAIRLMRSINPRSRELATHYNALGGFFYRFGRHLSAIRYFRRALEILESQAPDSVLSARTQSNLGYCLLGRDEPRLALHHFRLAIRIQHRIHRSLGNERDRQTYLAERASPYKGALAAMFSLGPERHGEALLLSEEYRAQTLLDLLIRRDEVASVETEPAVPDLANELNQARRRIAALHRNLGAATPVEPRRGKWIAELAEAEARAAELDERSGARRRGFEFSATPVDLAAVQASLEPQELLLAYFIHDEDAYGWAVRANLCVMFAVTGPMNGCEFTAQQLGEEIGTLLERRELLTELAGKLPPELRSQHASRCAELWQQNEEGAVGLEESARARLSRWLLGPVPEGAWDGVKSVWLLPHGPLFTFPFEMLSLPDGRLFGEAFSTTYTPSWSVLERLRRTIPLSPVRNLVLLTNPDFRDPKTYPPLSFHPRERRATLALANRVRIFAGPDAHKGNLRDHASQADILHLATHCDLSAVDPLLGLLALAPEPGTDPNVDEHLRVHEVFDLRLNARLVTLSACRSGAGRLLAGEGVVGFSQAFLAAGARCLVLTLWPVSPPQMAVLIEPFYLALGRGESVAEALRAARLALRRENPDPLLWAAPIAVGAAFERFAPSSDKPNRPAP